jgi:predicted  nucleic acid-binding Zn-ribbon protein
LSYGEGFAEAEGNLNGIRQTIINKMVETAEATGDYGASKNSEEYRKYLEELYSTENDSIKDYAEKLENYFKERENIEKEIANLEESYYSFKISSLGSDRSYE